MRKACIPFVIICLFGLIQTAQAQPIAAGYDSLRRILPLQHTAKDSLYLFQQLVDADPTFSMHDAANVTVLLKLNERLHLIDPQPYLLLQKAWLYTRSAKTQQALETTEEAVRLFDRQHKKMNCLLFNMRLYFNTLNDQEARLKFYQRQLEYYQVNGPYENIAPCYHGLAGYYYYKAEYNLAITNYLLGAEVYRKFSGYFYYNAVTVVASNYAYWGNYERAQYYLKDVVRPLMDKYGKGNYNNWTTTYWATLGLIDEHYKRPDKALYDFDRAIAVYTNQKENTGIEAALMVRKAILLLETGRVEQALPLLNRARIVTDSGKYPIFTTQGPLEVDYGFYLYYKKIGQNNKAAQFLQSANTKAAKEHANGLRLKYFHAAVDFYEAMRQPYVALQFGRRYRTLLDSLDGEEAKFKIAQFEIDQKDRQQQDHINQLKQEKAIRDYQLGRRNMLLLVSLAVVLVVLALLLFIYRQLHVNKKTLIALRNTQRQLEHQNHELAVEAGLDRVRARAMAMQNSNELAELVGTVYHELTKLDLKINHCMIQIFNPDMSSTTAWIAATMVDNVPSPAVLKFHDQPYYKALVAAWKRRDPKWMYELRGEEKKILDRIVLDAPEVKANIPKVITDSMIANDSIFLCFSFNNFGGIQADSLEPLSNAQLDILNRFSTVFDQGYTRFNDLKQAENRALEAKIEVALERVRSRTLAMQKSDELAETAAVLFRQMIGLGIEPNRLYIAIANEASTEMEFWVTDEDGSKISTMFSGDSGKNRSMKKMRDAWKAHEKSLVIDMQADELADYFHYLSELHVPFKGGLEQKRRLQYISFFSSGFIGMASPDEQPQATIDLLDRFAYVFNLTFARFNDLKLAEKHSLQAAEDLVKLQAEKKRAEDALTSLRTAQKQLIQTEKMASLGELTAGIAHEIQNPLNFVNNFSEVNTEMLEELKEESLKPKAERDEQLQIELINSLIANEQKINHHGKRADGIVKGMLEHSRASTGQKEPTDLNKLADEYLRLAYHGLRAKDKSFNAELVTHFDEKLPLANVIPQDMGRVLLNLFNNAFYAVKERAKTAGPNYKPTVEVITFTPPSPKESAGTEGWGVSVRDNGNGIPRDIKDKIMQPFFTTKPTGEGTGLGLSLSYDIVVKGHGGNLSVESREGDGSEFVVSLPI